MSVLKKYEFAPITAEQIRNYCEASGDWNKIHWDQKFAEEAGLPGIIAHGMLTMGLAATALESWGYGYDRIASWDAKFKEKVALGESLEARLEASNRPNTLEIRMFKTGEIEVLQASVLLR